MTVLLWTLSLLFGAIVLGAIARRIKVPSPSLFALAGVLLALWPHSPRFSIQPELALALFVAPILMSAGFEASLHDLRENWVALVGLIFVAVAITTAGVAIVARWLVPSMPWAVAITLGAAVSPPDAAAATAVLNEVRLPHRLLAVLEGESLLNDASALLIYRMAMGAALAHTESPFREISGLVLVLVGSVVLGAIAGVVMGNLVNRFSHVPSSIALQFIGVLGIWVFADKIELSGVLVTVVAAIVLSRNAALNMPAAVRVPSHAVWDTAVFILNALAFILVGLQLGPILDRLGSGPHPQKFAFALATLITVIVTRMGWTVFSNLAMRAMGPFLGPSPRRHLTPPPIKRSILGGWCGMRGIVTLGAVLALPSAFPYRDLVVLAAVTVVIGTLVIQGLTLRPLVTMLGMVEEGPGDNDIAEGRMAMVHAALQSLASKKDDAAAYLRAELANILDRTDGSRESFWTEEANLRRSAHIAARKALSDLRRSGKIGEAAFHKLQSELDMVELESEARAGW